MYNVQNEYTKFASDNSDKVFLVRWVEFSHSPNWVGAIFRILATGEEVYICQSGDLASLIA